MKVLLLSHSDISGGAARAAYRLHQGLRSIDVQSQMLVQQKLSDNSHVMGSSISSGIGQVTNGVRLILDQMPLKRYSKRNRTTFSPQWVPDNLVSRIAKVNPDVVNLHWVNGGYMQIESLARLSQPLVWTLHDMWAFTGGCHYNQDCDRYRQSCGRCPQLGSTRERDLSRQIWRRKAKAWKNLDLTLVALSSWMATCASSSPLFEGIRVVQIPNGIDTTIYRPFDRQTARQLLGLPLDKRLILSGSLKATRDKRKGLHLLQAALQDLAQSGWNDNWDLVVIGASQPEEPPDVGFNTHYLGTLNDDLALALAYSAADVFVAPSLQDNLPNTVMEAIACGTPCVAFNIGGMPDLIEHQKNGYLARPFEIQDLAQGIVWVVDNVERHQNLSKRAREKTEQEFASCIQAHRYASLFNELQQNAVTLSKR